MTLAASVEFRKICFCLRQPSAKAQRRPPILTVRVERADKRSVSATGSETRISPAGEVSAPGSSVDPTVLRVARQPILDRDARLIGYELLFREPPAEHAEVLDDRAATATVIVDGLLDVGLLDLVGGGLAYLNVSRDFLLSVRPLPLPARHVVLELLEDQVVDGELLEVLEELVEQGFTIALDDFRLTSATEQLLSYARIVKVDVLEHTGQDLEDLLAHLNTHDPSLTLLAEKVETREEFERCRELGFQSFQGYFFARPSLVQQQRLPSQGLTALGAMAELSATDDFDELNRIITRDVGLSMRLLRYANSAYVALPRRVGSVQEGLSWLGAITVRRFALMAALASARDVPDVLLVTALERGRMCQLLSGAGEGTAGDSYFTVGMFSVADALANAPMREVIEQLPFREDIAAALLRGGGELGELLSEVMAYERGDFDAAAALIRRHPDIEQIYREATRWADRGIAELA
jgi:EAL and modified HD-GYP domain-containing signal transduction protein